MEKLKHIKVYLMHRHFMAVTFIAMNLLMSGCSVYSLREHDSELTPAASAYFKRSGLKFNYGWREKAFGAKETEHKWLSPKLQSYMREDAHVILTEGGDCGNVANVMIAGLTLGLLPIVCNYYIHAQTVGETDWRKAVSEAIWEEYLGLTTTPLLLFPGWESPPKQHSNVLEIRKQNFNPAIITIMNRFADRESNN